MATPLAETSSFNDILSRSVEDQIRVNTKNDKNNSLETL